jgi:MFS family permease
MPASIPSSDGLLPLEHNFHILIQMSHGLKETFKCSSSNLERVKTYRHCWLFFTSSLPFWIQNFKMGSHTGKIPVWEHGHNVKWHMSHHSSMNKKKTTTAVKMLTERNWYNVIMPTEMFPMAGALLGCLLSWLPLRYMGRRATLQLVMAPLLIAGCCLMFVFHHVAKAVSPILLLGVSLQGAALGVSFTAIPVYLLEMMCKTCRCHNWYNIPLWQDYIRKLTSLFCV